MHIENIIKLTRSLYKISLPASLFKESYYILMMLDSRRRHESDDEHLIYYYREEHAWMALMIYFTTHD